MVHRFDALHEIGIKRFDVVIGDFCVMVEQGAGLAIVPETAAQRYGRFMDFRALEINDDWADRELYLCVRNEVQLPHHARALLEHLLSYVEKIAGRP
jgi:DNA-binding transcriptional LysR family regulator